MTARLILIRHAETEGNKSRYVGKEDLPLNETGVRQALDLAASLAAVHIDAILSSPMQRAVSTAMPLAQARSLPVVTDAGLVEVDYGSLQGDIKGGRPFSLRREYAETPMPGGESLKDVWKRLSEPMQSIKQAREAGQTLAVVSHYWSGRMLFAMVQGQGFEQAIGKSSYKPKNASALALDWAAGGLIDSKWLHNPEQES
jgi:broad specificity phosphatase PhoE